MIRLPLVHEPLWLALGIDSSHPDNGKEMPHSLHNVLTAAGWDARIAEFVETTDFAAIVDSVSDRKQGLALAKQVVIDERNRLEKIFGLTDKYEAPFPYPGDTTKRLRGYRLGWMKGGVLVRGQEPRYAKAQEKANAIYKLLSSSPSTSSSSSSSSSSDDQPAASDPELLDGEGSDDELSDDDVVEISGFHASHSASSSSSASVATPTLPQSRPAEKLTKEQQAAKDSKAFGMGKYVKLTIDLTE